MLHHLTKSFLVYPETRNRSLESIDALFSTSSPFHWKMEQAYKLHGDVLAEHGVTKSEEALEIGKPELTSTPAEIDTERPATGEPATV
jgi:hypothetical protein